MNWFARIRRIGSSRSGKPWTRWPSGGDSSLESAIAISRTGLSTSALLIVSFEATDPPVYAVFAHYLVAAYAGFAILVLVLMRTRIGWVRRTGTVVLACDLAFAVLLALATRGPASPFFPLLTFALISSAYRWGAHETLVTTAVAAGAVALETVLVGTSTPFSVGLLSGDFEWSRPVAGVTYLAATGLLLAVAAENGKQQRGHASVIASIMNHERSPGARDGTLEAVLGLVMRACTAERALLVLREVPTDLVFLWDATSVPGSESAVVAASELDEEQSASYFFEVPGPSWHALRLRAGSDWFDLMALDASGNRLPTVAFTLPHSLLAVHECNGVLGTSILFGDEWTARLFLIDPAMNPTREAALRLADRVAREIGPAAHQAYLLGTLRVRAASVERARLASELHDGVVQSLVAVEIEVELVRRRSTRDAPQLVKALTHLQTMLRDETRNLRKLTDRLKSVDSTARPVASLTDLVARFERDTGIEACFLSEPRFAGLSRRASHEVSRILQEGLVNVRKHSGARHVLVRAATGSGVLKLSIEDDGCGFPFSGRLSEAEMNAAHQGPVVIIERVRALGGLVSVESNPGQGARVEVSIPLEA